MELTFFDELSQQSRTIEVECSVVWDAQRWDIGTCAGIVWAVPIGWPNNAQPVCQELCPEFCEALPDECLPYYIAPQQPEVLLGRRDLVAAQREADQARGGFAAMVCGYSPASVA
jgi:hypothetical protein